MKIAVKGGQDVVLAEQAPRLRTGGYLIDFWGGGYDIAEKMGLIPRLQALGYETRELRYTDEHGRRTGGFSVDVFRRMTHGRFTELRRSDLAATICGAIRDGSKRCSGIPSRHARIGATAYAPASITPPRARSIWSWAPTGCTHACAGSSSGPKPGSRSPSAITSPPSRSTAPAA